MALPFESSPTPNDPRAARILAKTIYRELRGSGFSERDVMALAGELLALVTTEVKGQSGPTDRCPERPGGGRPGGPSPRNSTGTDGP